MDQKDFLKSRGLKGEFPEALTVVTAIVLTLIHSQGQKSLYFERSTRTKPITFFGRFFDRYLYAYSNNSALYLFPWGIIPFNIDSAGMGAFEIFK